MLKYHSNRPSAKFLRTVLARLNFKIAFFRGVGKSKNNKGNVKKMSIFDIFKQIENKEPEPAGAVEYIIVGLGNPGTEYENTRHNIGFMTIDTLCEKYKVNCKKLKFKSLTCDAMIAGKRCLIMKP